MLTRNAPKTHDKASVMSCVQVVCAVKGVCVVQLGKVNILCGGECLSDFYTEITEKSEVIN